MRAIDLFCGLGGASAGLQAAGIDVVAGYDINRQAIESYRMNFPAADAVLTDIRNIRGPDIPPADIWWTSAPCTPFSSLNNYKNRAIYQSKMKEDAELLNVVPKLIATGSAPTIVMGEQVSNAAKSPQMEKFMLDMHRLGYVSNTRIIDCVHYGIAQYRKRFLFVLTIHGHRSAVIPNGNILEPFLTVRDAIADLPPLVHGERHPEIQGHFCRSITEINLRRLQYIGPNGSWRDIPPELRPGCKRSDRDSHNHSYGRLDWDKPAGTLTGGCTTLSRGKFAHPDQMRAISAREAARLQGFPDTFILPETNDRAAIGIGNAVPPPIAEMMAQTVLHQETTT